MSIRLKHIIAVATALLLGALSMSAQVDRRDVRAGNRQFRKENWREADIDYRKALVKDSTSIAANYNLASNLYRQGNFDEAAKVMEKIKETAPATANAADYYYNTGDIAIEKKRLAGCCQCFQGGASPQSGRHGCEGELHLCQEDAGESEKWRRRTEQ